MPKSKRKRRSNSASGYFGVSLRGKRYIAQIKNNGKLKGLGTYDTAKQAAIAYDHAVHKHRLLTSQLNFPTMKHNLNKEPIRKKRKVSSTGFRGVDQNGKGYRAQLYFDGKQHNLGYFHTGKEAAHAYDQAILKYNKPIAKLNFPPQTTTNDIQIKEEPKDDEISSNSEWV